MVYKGKYAVFNSVRNKNINIDSVNCVFYDKGSVFGIDALEGKRYSETVKAVNDSSVLFKFETKHFLDFKKRFEQALMEQHRAHSRLTKNFAELQVEKRRRHLITYRKLVVKQKMNDEKQKEKEKQEFEVVSKVFDKIRNGKYSTRNSKLNRTVLSYRKAVDCSQDSFKLNHQDESERENKRFGEDIFGQSASENKDVKRLKKIIGKTTSSRNKSVKFKSKRESKKRITKPLNLTGIKGGLGKSASKGVLTSKRIILSRRPVRKLAKSNSTILFDKMSDDPLSSFSTGMFNLPLVCRLNKPSRSVDK